MAFDTRNKRMVAVSVLSVVTVVMPEPSGGFDAAAERLQLLKLLGAFTPDIGEPTVFHAVSGSLPHHKTLGQLPHHKTPGQLPHHKASDNG
jgi:hypothetical protein